MQQSDPQERQAVNVVTRYGFPHAKGIILGIVILIGASFIKGGKAKRMDHQETREVKNYDLSQFEKTIRDSKKLLKK